MSDNVSEYCCGWDHILRTPLVPLSSHSVPNLTSCAGVAGLTLQDDTPNGLLDLAYDVLGLEALFLVPRIFSLLSLNPYFGTLVSISSGCALRVPGCTIVALAIPCQCVLADLVLRSHVSKRWSVY